MGITGRNGTGKTNLLDAIYYLCYTKSYFSPFQQSSVKDGTDGFRLEGVFRTNATQQDTVSVKWKAGKKEITLNGSAYDKPTDHIGRFAAVMIAPDDLEIINGPGEYRRKWIDSVLGQTDRTYLESLLQYQRILQQRNAWLKRYSIAPPHNSAELDFYNFQLSRQGDFLAQQRAAFTVNFLPKLVYFYEQLSGGRERLLLQYQSDVPDQSMEHLLAESFHQDLRLQRTTKGVHRDDLHFLLNDKDLKQFGSQGQKKSYLFALKLAQYEYISRLLTCQPILLLDDIFEKLDQYRIEALLHIIQGPAFGQVVLTDTHKERVRSAFGTSASIDFISLGS